MTYDIVIGVCHMILSLEYDIWYCHWSMSYDIVIGVCHMILSLENVIWYCHWSMSYDIVIGVCHMILSLEYVIWYCHWSTSYAIVIIILTITKEFWIKLTSNNILVCVKWFKMRARCSFCCYQILVELLTIIHNKCKCVCYAILYLFSKYIQNADLALF